MKQPSSKSQEPVPESSYWKVRQSPSVCTLLRKICQSVSDLYDFHHTGKNYVEIIGIEPMTRRTL